MVPQCCMFMLMLVCPCEFRPEVIKLFSSAGQSPGRAIVLPPASALASASALAKSLTLKFFM